MSSSAPQSKGFARAPPQPPPPPPPPPPSVSPPTVTLPQSNGNDDGESMQNANNTRPVPPLSVPAPPSFPSSPAPLGEAGREGGTTTTPGVGTATPAQRLKPPAPPPLPLATPAPHIPTPPPPSPPTLRVPAPPGLAAAAVATPAFPARSSSPTTSSSAAASLDLLRRRGNGPPRPPVLPSVSGGYGSSASDTDEAGPFLDSPTNSTARRIALPSPLTPSSPPPPPPITDCFASPSPPLHTTSPTISPTLLDRGAAPLSASILKSKAALPHTTAPNDTGPTGPSHPGSPVSGSLSTTARHSLVSFVMLMDPDDDTGADGGGAVDAVRPGSDGGGRAGRLGRNHFPDQDVVMSDDSGAALVVRPTKQSAGVTSVPTAAGTASVSQRSSRSGTNVVPSFRDRIQQGRAPKRKPTAVRRRSRSGSSDGDDAGAGRNTSSPTRRRSSAAKGGARGPVGSRRNSRSRSMSISVKPPPLLPSERFASLVYVGYFHVKMLVAAKRLRAQQHFLTVSGPRAAFVIQCCWRRYRQRQRLRYYTAVRFLQPWLRFRMTRLRRAKEQSALVLQRVFRGAQTRALTRFLIDQMHKNRALQLIQRFIRRWEAQIVMRQLRFQREERNVLLHRCHHETLSIIRAERGHFLELAREAVEVLGIRPFVPNAEYVEEVTALTGVAPVVLRAMNRYGAYGSTFGDDAGSLTRRHLSSFMPFPGELSRSSFGNNTIGQVLSPIASCNGLPMRLPRSRHFYEDLLGSSTSSGSQANSTVNSFDTPHSFSAEFKGRCSVQMDARAAGGGGSAGGVVDGSSYSNNNNTVDNVNGGGRDGDGGGGEHGRIDGAGRVGPGDWSPLHGPRTRAAPSALATTGQAQHFLGSLFHPEGCWYLDTVLAQRDLSVESGVVATAAAAAADENSKRMASPPSTRRGVLLEAFGCWDGSAHPPQPQPLHRHEQQAKTLVTGSLFAVLDTEAASVASGGVHETLTNRGGEDGGIGNRTAPPDVFGMGPCTPQSRASAAAVAAASTASATTASENALAMLPLVFEAVTGVSAAVSTTVGGVSTTQQGFGCDTASGSTASVAALAGEGGGVSSAGQSPGTGTGVMEGAMSSTAAALAKVPPPPIALPRPPLPPSRIGAMKSLPRPPPCTKQPPPLTLIAATVAPPAVPGAASDAVAALPPTQDEQRGMVCAGSGAEEEAPVAVPAVTPREELSGAKAENGSTTALHTQHDEVSAAITGSADAGVGAESPKSSSLRRKSSPVAGLGSTEHTGGSGGAVVADEVAGAAASPASTDSKKLDSLATKDRPDNLEGSDHTGSSHGSSHQGSGVSAKGDDDGEDEGDNTMHQGSLSISTTGSAERVACAAAQIEELKRIHNDGVLSAYVGLLCRTEAIERKALEQELLTEHASFVHPVQLVSYAIHLSRHQRVPSLYAPLLLRFNEFLYMRLAAKCFADEQKQRMAILEEYDALPLEHLSRPVFSSVAEDRRRALVTLVASAADPFPRAVEEEVKYFSEVLRSLTESKEQQQQQVVVASGPGLMSHTTSTGLRPSPFDSPVVPGILSAHPSAPRPLAPLPAGSAGVLSGWKATPKDDQGEENEGSSESLLLANEEDSRSPRQRKFTVQMTPPEQLGVEEGTAAHEQAGRELGAQAPPSSAASARVPSARARKGTTAAVTVVDPFPLRSFSMPRRRRRGPPIPLLRSLDPHIAAASKHHRPTEAPLSTPPIVQQRHHMTYPPISSNSVPSLPTAMTPVGAGPDILPSSSRVVYGRTPQASCQNSQQLYSNPAPWLEPSARVASFRSAVGASGQLASQRRSPPQMFTGLSDQSQVQKSFSNIVSPSRRQRGKRADGMDEPTSIAGAQPPEQQCDSASDHAATAVVAASLPSVPSPQAAQADNGLSSNSGGGLRATQMEKKNWTRSSRSEHRGADRLNGTAFPGTAHPSSTSLTPSTDDSSDDESDDGYEESLFEGGTAGRGAYTAAQDATPLREAAQEAPSQSKAQQQPPSPPPRMRGNETLESGVSLWGDFTEMDAQGIGFLLPPVPIGPSSLSRHHAGARNVPTRRQNDLSRVKK